MSLAAAVFVFTVTFIKDIIGDVSKVQHPCFLAIAWAAMIISLLAGTAHLAAWERYFITWRDYSHDREAGDKKRAGINRIRKGAMYFQVLSFGIGLAGVSLFAWHNMFKP